MKLFTGVNHDELVLLLSRDEYDVIKSDCMDVPYDDLDEDHWLDEEIIRTQLRSEFMSFELCKAEEQKK